MNNFWLQGFKNQALINIFEFFLNFVVLAENVSNDFEDLDLANDDRGNMRHPLVIQGQILLVLLDLVNNVVNQLYGVRILL